MALRLVERYLYKKYKIFGIEHYFKSNASFGSDVLTSKAILCLGLIYFYYRSVFVYLPISPTLGPMLVKMNYMVSCFIYVNRVDEYRRRKRMFKRQMLIY